MKLVKQSFEFINQTDFSLVGIKKQIERCARVSYKSENRITEDSYEKFVNMLINRGHDRPLEFGTVHLKMNYGELIDLQDTLTGIGIYNDYWLRWNEEIIDSDDNIFVTTNYRYFLEIIKQHPWIEELLDESDSEYYPKRYTVHMILSRGVMDEFRTHVGLSHLAESTRYCNYSKDKFGNEVTFIIPSWLSMEPQDSMNTKEIYSGEDFDDETPKYIWLNALNCAEIAYKNLLQKGWTPQQARSVLPLSIKSELISCGFEDVWNNFFSRRCASDAHPMAQEIAKPMYEEYLKLIKC